MFSPYTLPRLTRKQISVHKFMRVKNMPVSKRVRSVLSLRQCEIQEALDAYDLRDFYYAYHGNQVENNCPRYGSCATITNNGYKTNYFRYEKTAALFSTGRIQKYE